MSLYVKLRILTLFKNGYIYYKKKKKKKLNIKKFF